MTALGIVQHLSYERLEEEAQKDKKSKRFITSMVTQSMIGELLLQVRLFVYVPADLDEFNAN